MSVIWKNKALYAFGITLGGVAVFVDYSLGYEYGPGTVFAILSVLLLMAIDLKSEYTIPLIGE